MKALSVITTLISNMVFVMLGLMALYVLSSNVSIFGGYKSLLVQSGSMEPTIMTGDIILIRPFDKYIQNDVVTFTDAENRIVTHRIKKISTASNKSLLTMKGDANSSNDADPITFDQIMGKVTFTIPKLGYLVAFSKSLPGLIILIMIPAALFIIDELGKMKNV